VITTTRDEFDERVRQARAAHPVWFDLEPDGTPTEQHLDELERALGVGLPADYRWFLTTYGGGDFALAAVYSGDEASALYLPRNQPEHPPHGFVAMGDDGTGNLYGFPVLDGRGIDEVVLLDHETGEVRGLAGGGILDFIAQVVFQPGSPGW
jgi:hypothetical protein